MKRPKCGDFIDIHTHGAASSEGVYVVESLMTHEERIPEDIPEQACSFGIHPWHLSVNTLDKQIDKIRASKDSENLIAIGEAGFDKLKGPSLEIQKKAFEKQVLISEETGKPLVIHCVRAWDELLPAYKSLKPTMPWIIHGFRGNAELAGQLLSKGMYLSFWFDFIIRPESAGLLRHVPSHRIFLETDGSDTSIKAIYEKVASDLGMTVEMLKSAILVNFNKIFNFNG